ncbi:hypothetical protein Esti_001513 [Eimeria stiedai]
MSSLPHSVPPRVSPSWFRFDQPSGFSRRVFVPACLSALLLCLAYGVFAAVYNVLHSVFLCLLLCLSLLLYLLYSLTLALTFPGSNGLFQWHLNQQLATEAADELLHRLQPLEALLYHLLSLSLSTLPPEETQTLLLTLPGSCLSRSLSSCSNSSSNSSSSSGANSLIPLLNDREAVSGAAWLAGGDGAAKRKVADAYFLLSAHLLAFQSLHLKRDAFEQQQQQPAAEAAGAAAPGWHKQQKARLTLSWLQDGLAFSMASLLSSLSRISLATNPTAPNSSNSAAATVAAAATAAAGGMSARRVHNLLHVVGLPPPSDATATAAADEEETRGQQPRLCDVRLAAAADVRSCAAALQHLQAMVLLLLPFQGGSVQQQQLEQPAQQPVQQQQGFLSRLLLLLFRCLVAPPLATLSLLQQQAANQGLRSGDAAGVEVWLPVLQARKRVLFAAAVSRAAAATKRLAARRCCSSSRRSLNCSSSRLNEQHQLSALLQSPAEDVEDSSPAAAVVPVAGAARRSRTAAAAGAAAAAAAKLLQLLVQPIVWLFRPPPADAVYLQCVFVPATGTHWLLPASCCSAAAAAAAREYDFHFPPSSCRCYAFPAAANTPTGLKEQQLLLQQIQQHQQQQQQQQQMWDSSRCAALRALLAGGQLRQLASEASLVQAAAFSLFAFHSQQHIAAAAFSAAAAAAGVQAAAGAARRFRAAPRGRQRQQWLAAAAVGKVAAALAAAAAAAAAKACCRGLVRLRIPRRSFQQHGSRICSSSSSSNWSNDSSSAAAGPSGAPPLRFVCGCLTQRHARLCEEATEAAPSRPAAAATAAAATAAAAAATAAAATAAAATAAAATAATAAAGLEVGGDVVVMFNPNAGALEMCLAGRDPEMECYLNRGCSVLLWNYRGCSSSGGQASPVFLFSDAASVSAFAAQLPALHALGCCCLPHLFANVFVSASLCFLVILLLVLFCLPDCYLYAAAATASRAAAAATARLHSALESICFSCKVPTSWFSTADQLEAFPQFTLHAFRSSSSSSSVLLLLLLLLLPALLSVAAPLTSGSSAAAATAAMAPQPAAASAAPQPQLAAAAAGAGGLSLQTFSSLDSAAASLFGAWAAAAVQATIRFANFMRPPEVSHGSSSSSSSADRDAALLLHPNNTYSGDLLSLEEGSCERNSSSSSSSSESGCGSLMLSPPTAAAAAAECVGLASSVSAFLSLRCSKLQIFSPTDEVVANAAALKTAVSRRLMLRSRVYVQPVGRSRLISRDFTQEATQTDIAAAFERRHRRKLAAAREPAAAVRFLHLSILTLMPTSRVLSFASFPLEQRDCCVSHASLPAPTQQQQQQQQQQELLLFHAAGNRSCCFSLLAANQNVRVEYYVQRGHLVFLLFVTPFLFPFIIAVDCLHALLAALTPLNLPICLCCLYVLARQ